MLSQGIEEIRNSKWTDILYSRCLSNLTSVQEQRIGKPRIPNEDLVTRSRCNTVQKCTSRKEQGFLRNFFVFVDV